MKTTGHVLFSGAAPLAPGTHLCSIVSGFLGRTFNHLFSTALFFYSWNTSKHGNSWGSYLEIKPDSNRHFLNWRLSTATSNRPFPSRITSWNKGLKEVSVWPMLKCFCFALGRGESEHVQTAQFRLLKFWSCNPFAQRFYWLSLEFCTKRNCRLHRNK